MSRAKFFSALLLAVAFLLTGWNFAFAAPDVYAHIDPARVDAIAAMLPEKPVGFGAPIANRTYWGSSEAASLTAGTVKNAAKYLTTALPSKLDPGILKNLVLGECVENKGRFLPLICQEMEIFLKTPDWGIALTWTPNAADLATALFLLGEKLEATDPGLRTRVLAILHARCFDGVYNVMLTGKITAYNDWINADDNWQPVCWDNMVSAACSLLPDRHQRAGYIAAAEYYIAHYRKTFSSDGCCKEGGGYYNYGITRFIELREVIKCQTKGQVDIFSDPLTPLMASFSIRYHLNNFVFPPFGDSQEGATASQNIMGYFNRVFGFGLSQFTGDMKGSSRLGQALMTPTPLVPAAPPSTQNFTEIRTYFSIPGVLACRPSVPTSRLAAAIKAGGNIPSHSHNDVGSFYLQLGTDLQIGDPGGPRTYPPGHADVYTYAVDNSYGRSLPVIGGTLQIAATSAHPVVTQTSFTEKEDVISIDLTSAYRLPALKNIVRTMRYDRQGAGALSIRDEVSLSAPTAFQAALTTRAKVTPLSQGFLLFEQGSESIYGLVSTPDGYTLTSETIQELPPTLPWTRLAFDLKKPVTSASVVLQFSNLPSVAAGITAQGANLTGIANPGGKSLTVAFDYGTTTSYGSRTAPKNIGSGTTGVIFSTSLSGLRPGTLYHFRSVATAGNTTLFGPDETFTTDASTALVNRAIGGIATASHEGLSSETAGRAFDGLTADKWFSGEAGGAGWIRYEFGGSSSWKVVQYTLASADDFPARDPKTWQFQGSNDGTNWTTLDTRNNEIFTARFQTRTFTLSSPAAYKFHQLKITANNGDPAGIQIAEFGLFADSAPAPTLNVPASIALEATSRAGAVATFTTTAIDSAGERLVASAKPASGSVFPVGITDVIVSAANAAGSTTTKRFQVTIRDSTPPVISVPENQTVLATAANGAKVNFTTSALDAVSGLLPTQTTIKSGELFPIGVTSVKVQATDENGNTALKTFQISVVVPAIAEKEKVAPKIALSGNSIHLTVTAAVPGRTFQLQRSETLEPGSWIDAGPIQVGNGVDLILSDVYDARIEKRFYRLLLGP